MDISINILILTLSVFALWGGAVWIVESASRIAGKLGVSELIIGLTIVALGTSAPEFAVTISAALSNKANISVGNIVGSNIFNMGFILGGIAIVKALTVTPKLLYRDGGLLLASSLTLLYFLYDSEISRIEGITLMVILCVYLVYLFMIKEKPEEEDIVGVYHWLDIFRLVIGLALVVSGGHFLVLSATELAEAANISRWVIAVTIVAAGTSAPEFVTSLIAIIKGKYGLSAGNLVGSDIFNLLGVLGIASFIQPMKIVESSYTDILLLAGLIMLVLIFFRTGWKLSRTEGIVLVSINLIRWVISFTA
jgi:cation:H+ antiporter